MSDPAFWWDIFIAIAIFFGVGAVLLVIAIIATFGLLALALNELDRHDEDYPDSRFDPDIVGDASTLDHPDVKHKPEPEPRGA